MTKFKSKAELFGKNNGYKFVSFFESFNEFEVYVAETSEEVEHIGYPVMILANNKAVRFSEPDETLKIMGVKPADNTNGEAL